MSPTCYAHESRSRIPFIACQRRREYNRHVTSCLKVSDEPRCEDKIHERARWNERYRTGRAPTQVNPRLQKYRHMLQRGRVLDLACGRGQNAQLFPASTVILVDIADEALARACGLRVLADAVALPFPANTFNTIVCAYFFDPRVDFARWLLPGGTLFFETYTSADAKYHPDFNPAHRFDPATRAEVFRGLEILLWEETDDGARVYGTLIGRKSA